MKTPSFRISINSAHLATVGLAGHGVCSCIIDWTDRSDVPERDDARVRMSLGGFDHSARGFLDWPGHDLSIGDTVQIEIVDYCEPVPPPERRPVEAMNDLEKKKAYVRQAAKELGWVISEPPTPEAEGAAPNGGPATPSGNSGVTEGPPSVN